MGLFAEAVPVPPDAVGPKAYWLAKRTAAAAHPQIALHLILVGGGGNVIYHPVRQSVPVNVHQIGHHTAS